MKCKCFSNICNIRSLTDRCRPIVSPRLQGRPESQNPSLDVINEKLAAFRRTLRAVESAGQAGYSDLDTGARLLPVDCVFSSTTQSRLIQGCFTDAAVIQPLSHRNPSVNQFFPRALSAPASTKIDTPVTLLDSSPAKNRAALAISIGSTRCLSSVLPAISAAT